MPMTRRSSVGSGGGVGGVVTEGIFVDALGWLNVPGQLPSKTRSEVQPNGNIKVSYVVLVNGAERVIGSSEEPA